MSESIDPEKVRKNLEKFIADSAKEFWERFDRECREGKHKTPEAARRLYRSSSKYLHNPDGSIDVEGSASLIIGEFRERISRPSVSQVLFPERCKTYTPGEMARRMGIPWCGK